MVTVAIKRARAAAIIPYTISRKEVVVNPFEIIK